MGSHGGKGGTPPPTPLQLSRARHVEIKTVFQEINENRLPEAAALGVTSVWSLRPGVSWGPPSPAHLLLQTDPGTCWQAQAPADSTRTRSASTHSWRRQAPREAGLSLDLGCQGLAWAGLAGGQQAPLRRPQPAPRGPAPPQAVANRRVWALLPLHELMLGLTLHNSFFPFPFG